MSGFDQIESDCQWNEKFIFLDDLTSIKLVKNLFLDDLTGIKIGIKLDLTSVKLVWNFCRNKKIAHTCESPAKKLCAIYNARCNVLMGL